MINKVILSRLAEKQLKKVPLYVGRKLHDWMEDVRKRSLEEVRKIPGYNNEALKGKLAGYYSIRLNKSYRAYYRIIHERILFIRIERIDKHEY